MLLTERLTTAGRLAAGVAHELNNPLATIAGCAEALRERAQDPHLRDLDALKDFPGYLTLIDEEAHRCNEITGSLLHFVRDPGSRRAPTDLNVLVDKVLELIGHQSRYAQSRLERRPDAELPDVVANEGQLRQVFLGLASNALDAMNGKGTLTVTTRRRNAREVEIRFEDEGPGIPEHVLPRVFDPFFTTKPPGQGTGLGLAIAQGIVADHEGRIEVDTRMGARPQPGHPAAPTRRGGKGENRDHADPGAGGRRREEPARAPSARARPEGPRGHRGGRRPGRARAPQGGRPRRPPARHEDAERGRHRGAARAAGSPGGAPGHRDDRLPGGVHGSRGHEARSLQLPDQASPPRGARDTDAPGGEKAACART